MTSPARLTKPEFQSRCASILRRMATRDEGLVVIGLRRYLAKNTAPGGLFAAPTAVSDEDGVVNEGRDIGPGEGGDGDRDPVPEVDG